jgi:hypothetical protein
MLGSAMATFQKFSAEGAVIGRLIVGYSELELDLLNCVAMGIDDFDKAIKSMFGRRGESKRLDAAKLLGRPAYEGLHLASLFDQAITDARYCLKIRNQYAHHNFYDDNTGKLALVNLEELGKETAPVPNLLALTANHINVTLLEDQERYFLGVRATIGYINYEGRVRAKKISVNPFSLHAPLPRPKLSCPDTMPRTLQ